MNAQIVHFHTKDIPLRNVYPKGTPQAHPFSARYRDIWPLAELLYC